MNAFWFPFYQMKIGYLLADLLYDLMILHFVEDLTLMLILDFAALYFHDGVFQSEI